MLWAEPLSPRDETLAPGRPRAPSCPCSLCMGHLPDDTQGKAPHFPGPSGEAVGSRKEEPVAPQSAMAVRVTVGGGSQENLHVGRTGWADGLLDSTSHSTGRAAKVPQCLTTCPGSHTARQPQGPVHPYGELPLLGTCPVLCPCS